MTDCLCRGGAGNSSVVTEDHEETLEEAVKGIAAGIAGKAKEIAGELMDDPELEQQGIAQQEKSEELRSGNAAPG
jgi:uncharacterized protein YjbJ (UPF0337 family)